MGLVSCISVYCISCTLREGPNNISANVGLGGMGKKDQDALDAATSEAIRDAEKDQSQFDTTFDLSPRVVKLADPTYDQITAATLKHLREDVVMDIFRSRESQGYTELRQGPLGVFLGKPIFKWVATTVVRLYKSGVGHARIVEIIEEMEKTGAHHKMYKSGELVTVNITKLGPENFGLSTSRYPNLNGMAEALNDGSVGRGSPFEYSGGAEIRGPLTYRSKQDNKKKR